MLMVRARRDVSPTRVSGWEIAEKVSSKQSSRRGDVQIVRDPPLNEAGEPPHLRLLGVAREMFCRDGIHATGIDRILAEARVSKMTLYGRFGSKEALVREVLREEGEAWRTHFFAAVSAVSGDPREQLAGVVSALDPWFRGERFYGCAFMNAVAEHAKGEGWLRELAGEHQRLVVAFLARLAEEAGFTEPVMLARQVMLVIDGAIAALLVSGDPAVLDLTRRNLASILAMARDPAASP